MSWASSTGSAYSPVKNNSKCQDMSERPCFTPYLVKYGLTPSWSFQFLEYIALSSFLISHFHLQTAAGWAFTQIQNLSLLFPSATVKRKEVFFHIINMDRPRAGGFQGTATNNVSTCSVLLLWISCGCVAEHTEPQGSSLTGSTDWMFKTAGPCPSSVQDLPSGFG